MFLHKFIFLGLLFGISLSITQAEKSSQSSVLFINVDDWNDWNEVLQGHSQAITPNIKRLAERGVVFSNAICSSPSCFPSRTSLFTGVHPSRSGVIVNDNGMHAWRKYLPDATTLPKHLSNMGWKSIGIAKNFHKGDGPEFDQYYPKAKEIKAIKGSGVKLNSSGVWGIAAVETEQMPDYKAATQAIKTIHNHSGPLFLSMGIYRPHVPWIVPQKYFDLYPLDKLQVSKREAQDLNDLAERFKLIAHFETKFGKDYHQMLTEKGIDKQFIRAYLASVTFADEQLGRVLDAWYASPHSKHGYIILWSDHGYMLGEKEAWSKMKPWYDSSRCNLIMSGPGIKKGEFCHKAVSLQDLYPSLMDLLNISPPHQAIDGKSIVPLLKDPQAKWDKPVVMSSEAEGIRYDSILSNDFRMTKLITGEMELYHHKSDPHEFMNLANDPKYAVTIKELSTHLSFNYPPIIKGTWLEAESLPRQTSSDFKLRGNCHYPKSDPKFSGGQAICADLNAGKGSYLDIVLDIKEKGTYSIYAELSTTGSLDFCLDEIKNDSSQSDAGYPMKTLSTISNTENEIQLVSLGSITLDKPGFKIFRFQSKENKLRIQVDRIQLK